MSEPRAQPLGQRAAELLVSNYNRRLPRCTLIAAQAEAIDEQFFAGACFGELFERPMHLEEITFNATDFRAGLPFRFQKSRSTRVKIGNGKHAIPLEFAKQLRIADIVAASSCFPGGFEPLGFPHDFRWPNRADALQQLGGAEGDSPFASPIPLMDGGVADNQGVGSLIAAIERRRPEEAEVGLILISDADQAAQRPLLEHTRDPQPTGLRVGTVLILARVLTWLGAIASILLGIRLVNMLATGRFGSWLFFVETVFSLLVVSATCLALTWAGRTFRKLVWNRVPHDAGIDIAGTIKRTTTIWLGDLIWMRRESLFAMSNSVFMKNLRDLRAGVEPTAAMRQIAERAREMPTSLWFDHEGQLEEAILCGRFTGCYNLLKYVTNLPAERSEATAELRDRLQGLWQTLVAEVPPASAVCERRTTEA